jgi:hypothetical protein
MEASDESSKLLSIKQPVLRRLLELGLWPMKANKLFVVIYLQELSGFLVGQGDASFR